MGRKSSGILGSPEVENWDGKIPGIFWEKKGKNLDFDGKNPGSFWEFLREKKEKFQF